MSTSTPTAAGSRHHLGGHRSLGFVVITVSDTHTEDDDASGKLATTLLREAGHSIVHYDLVANSVADLRDRLEPYLADRAVEVAVTLGGTGVSSRDLSVTAVEGMGGRVLPGFGELYRNLSFSEVGPLSWLSRAGAYVVHNKPVFALPGSERAVRTALQKLVIPAIQHLVEELER